LVSTDPASNLKDVLESEVNDKINPVKGVENQKTKSKPFGRKNG
jgi:anion-transporting  ArsA/GET3 family ATPase